MQLTAAWNEGLTFTRRCHYAVNEEYQWSVCKKELLVRLSFLLFDSNQFEVTIEPIWYWILDLGDSEFNQRDNVIDN